MDGTVDWVKQTEHGDTEENDGLIEVHHGES